MKDTQDINADISNSEKIIEKFRQEKEFSKLIIDSLPGIFYLYSYPENRLILWNKQHETLLGYSAKEMKGRHATNWHLPEYKDAVSKAIDTVMEKGFFSIESTLVAKDGHQIPVFLTGTKFEIEDHLYFMGIGIDITNLKQTEDKLIASERKMHAIFDQTYELIGLMSLDGNLIEVNRAALQFSGIEAESVLDKPFWEGPWWAHSVELQEKIRESVEKVAKGEFVRFEATHIAKKDGLLHYIDFSLKPVKDETDKVVLMVPEGRDITEQKQIEIKLNEKLDELEKLNKYMVDRELKMVELKNEIESLKMQLKNQ